MVEINPMGLKARSCLWCVAASAKNSGWMSGLECHGSVKARPCIDSLPSSAAQGL